MFGLSGSSSRSRSSGSSYSFGQSSSQSGSLSSSISGGTSVAGSQDQSTSGSRSGQSVAFEDVFARLFGNAEGVAGNLDTSLLTTAANQLFSGGTDFLANLGGDVGSDFLASRLTGGDDLLQSQLGVLQGDIGKLFREELLPGITSEAVAGGQLGGGRQGVAQAGAADAAAEAFTRGAVDLRTRDLMQRDAIAQGISERNIQGTQVGLAGMPGLLEIASGGITAQTAPLQFLASILGDKSVLTQSESQSQSTGQSFSNAMDFARSLAESFGISQSTDMSASQTSSTSKSKSAGIGF